MFINSMCFFSLSLFLSYCLWVQRYDHGIVYGYLRCTLLRGKTFRLPGKFSVYAWVFAIYRRLVDVDGKWFDGNKNISNRLHYYLYFNSFFHLFLHESQLSIYLMINLTHAHTHTYGEISKENFCSEQNLIWLHKNIFFAPLISMQFPWTSTNMYIFHGGVRAYTPSQRTRIFRRNGNGGKKRKTFKRSLNESNEKKWNRIYVCESMWSSFHLLILLQFLLLLDVIWWYVKCFAINDGHWSITWLHENVYRFRLFRWEKYAVHIVSIELEIYCEAQPKSNSEPEQYSSNAHEQMIKCEATR